MPRTGRASSLSPGVDHTRVKIESSVFSSLFLSRFLAGLGVRLRLVSLSLFLLCVHVRTRVWARVGAWGIARFLPSMGLLINFRAANPCSIRPVG